MSRVLTRSRIVRVSVGVVLVLMLAGPPATAGAGGFAKAPKIGDKAPQFSLLTLEGQRVTLATELKGAPVVLVLLRGWAGSQCPFCTAQFADFLAHARELERSGARVAWIYPGPPDAVQLRAGQFTAGRPLPSNFRVVTDPDYAFTNAYGLRWDEPQETAYPATFVVDRTGVVRFAQISIGYDRRARAADVLQELAALARK